MGSYSPGETASPDNEATRPLRAGSPAQDGSAPSPGNFFVRLRAAWKLSLIHISEPTRPY